MHYHPSRNEILILMGSLKMPDQMKEKFAAEDIMLCIKEEKICNVVSAGIYQVLQDNSNKFFDLCGGVPVDSTMRGSCLTINKKSERG